MARQAVTKSALAKTVRWTHLQEVTFDDFFGKKLSYEGFTIEKVAGGYHVCSNPMDARPPAIDASSLGVETFTGQNAEPEIIVREKLLCCDEFTKRTGTL